MSTQAESQEKKRLYACSGLRRILTGPFSCKPLQSFSGWVVFYIVERQKAILHHLICSSHANKREGEWIGRTRLLLLPTTLPTHGVFSDYGKRITTTPLCLLVSLMGEAGEHHSPPVIGSVQVLMLLRGCVCPSLYPPANGLKPIPWGQMFLYKLLTPALSPSLRLSDHMRCAESQVQDRSSFFLFWFLHVCQYLLI